MKIIKVTEHGSNRELSVNSENINYFESITYNSGETVTIIYFNSGDEIHVVESKIEIENNLSN